MTSSRARVSFGRVHASAVPAPPVAPRMPETPLSPAGGEWGVDMVRAQHDAQILLNSIDWSQPDLVIWVPGTGSHSLDPAFEAAVRASWGQGGVSLNRLEYEASWNLRTSVATGVATLRIVLAEIARRGGSQRVLLAGQEQGAWVIGEVLADPKMRELVSRAVLFGHPSLAATHHHGSDGKVLEVNDAYDRLTQPVRGDATAALDRLIAAYRGTFADAARGAAAVLREPGLLAGWLQTKLAGSLLGDYLRNPSDYRLRMTDAVEFLRGANSQR